MFEKLQENKRLYERIIQNNRIVLEKAVESNKEYARLKVKQNDLKMLINEVSAYRNRLNVIHNVAKSEKETFENERLEFLNSIVTDAIAEIFPTKGYVAKISCELGRSDKAFIQLVDNKGHVMLPWISCGDLMKYLISYSSVDGICMALNKKNIYIDEAFSASSIDKLPRLGKRIQKSIEQGFQIIMISQNPLIYEDLPRREFRLEFDDVKQIASLNETVDL